MGPMEETNNTNSSKNNLIFVGVIVGIVAIIGGAVWYVTSNSAPQEEQQAGFNASVPAPSLDRELVFPETFPADARVVLEQNTKTVKDNLRETPTDYSSWLDLAIQYKTVGDHEGAEEVWVYLTKAAPTLSVAYHNLGNMYHLDLKEFEKAEENYKKAIELAPNEIIHWFGLHELYRYSYKTDSSLAVKVLEDALDQFKGTNSEVDIYAMFAGYYKQRGEKKDAIEYYTKARTKAEQLGRLDLVTQFENEIAALER